MTDPEPPEVVHSIPPMNLSTILRQLREGGSITTEYENGNSDKSCTRYSILKTERILYSLRLAVGKPKIM